jgi:hypothetical protein
MAFPVTDGHTQNIQEEMHESYNLWKTPQWICKHTKYAAKTCRTNSESLSVSIRSHTLRGIWSLTIYDRKTPGCRYTSSTRVSRATWACMTMFAISANSRKLSSDSLAPELTARNRWFSVLLCRFTAFSWRTKVYKLCRVELIEHKDMTVGGGDHWVAYTSHHVVLY